MEEGLNREDGSVIQIDDRIQSEGHNGTVRYIGSVPPTKGCWVGVEWDDPTRGKHNGTHEGKQYFTTEHPTGGSFVRPKKIEGGVSCFTALNDRYGKMEDENAGVVTDELFVVGSNNKQTVVEMVGAKKVNEQQSQLDQLQEVVLRDLLIYGLGSHGQEMSTQAPSIEELDISHNLLPSWECVAGIADSLPQLSNLNISENKLKFPDNPDELVSHFKNITVLYLNRMNYRWDQVLQCATMFESLKQLHVCFNCIQELQQPINQLENLHLLNLESNKIGSWTEIRKLGHLPQLEILILNNTELTEINFPDVQYHEKTKLFQELKSLSLNNNKISEWKSINELNKLQCLEKLKIKSNPIMDSATTETVRQLLIAKIGTLEKCNRTEISVEERRMAEFDYLKRFGPDWLKAGGNQDTAKNNPSQDFLCQHPRYEEMIEDHGAPEDSEMAQKARTLKDNLISVMIYSPYVPEKPPLKKNIPVTMSVQKLKTLVQRLFKLDGDNCIDLFYESARMKGPEIEMENDLRQVAFYSVESGDTICVRWH